MTTRVTQVETDGTLVLQVRMLRVMNKMATSFLLLMETNDIGKRDSVLSKFM